MQINDRTRVQQAAEHLRRPAVGSLWALAVHSGRPGAATVGRVRLSFP
jgi:hypothetical protein